jgi:hypothetical protein
MARKKAPKPPLEREQLSFEYLNRNKTMASRGPFHQLRAYRGPHFLGELNWASEGEPEVYDINVEKTHQRRGVATHLWNKAHELSRGNTSLVRKETDDGWWDNPRDYTIPAPVHSPHRTREGDSWAKSTGHSVPPLSKGQFWEDHSWEE